MKIGPVIHPTSTRQRSKASPGRHRLVILGTGQRRPRERRPYTGRPSLPVLVYIRIIGYSSSIVFRSAAEIRFESVVQKGVPISSKIFMVRVDTPKIGHGEPRQRSSRFSGRGAMISTSRRAGQSSSRPGTKRVGSDHRTEVVDRDVFGGVVHRDAISVASFANRCPRLR